MSQFRNYWMTKIPSYSLNIGKRGLMALFYNDFSMFKFRSSLYFSTNPFTK